MPARRKGQSSTVPIARTREKIQTLLRDWGCEKIAFLDDFTAGECTIQFVFVDPSGNRWAAQFVMQEPDLSGLTQRQADDTQRGAWRTLLYWLQACMDACDLGIIQPEALFLPWLVNEAGQTVSEIMLPRMERLGPGALMIGDGR